MHGKKKHPGEQALELIIMVGGPDKELPEVATEDESELPGLMMSDAEAPPEEVVAEDVGEEEDPLVELLRGRRRVA